jgi:hypothetical protein
MSTDTTTVLNPGSGGDSMDESSVVQADGSTTAKQPRVHVAFGADDVRSRLVSNSSPLPVADERALALLQQMADDVREMKIALLTFIDD